MNITIDGRQYELTGDITLTPLGDQPSLPNVIECWQNEMVYVQNCLSASNEVDQYYRLKEVITTQPSWRGARVGGYYDALEPIDFFEPGCIARIKIPKDVMVLSACGYTFHVSDQVMPDKLFPMYAEVQSQACLDAHTKATGARDWAMQGPITVKYIDLVRSFGIEPFKQSMVNYADIDQYGDYSFRKLVLENCIAAPLLWAGSIGDAYAPTPNWIRQVDSQAPADSMFYAADEPNGNGMGTAATLARMDLLERYSSLTPMITAQHYIEYELYEPAYCVVQNHWDIVGRPLPSAYQRQFGSYSSCMATGSCVNTATPAERTLYPAAVIEADPVDDIQRMITLAHKSGASFFLYYSITKKLNQCWDSGGQYDEGGNGDGTMLYYNPSNGDPWPSTRMMNLHIALQKVTKLEN